VSDAVGRSGIRSPSTRSFETAAIALPFPLLKAPRAGNSAVGGPCANALKYPLPVRCLNHHVSWRIACDHVRINRVSKEGIFTNDRSQISILR